MKMITAAKLAKNMNIHYLTMLTWIRSGKITPDEIWEDPKRYMFTLDSAERIKQEHLQNLSNREQDVVIL